MAINHGLPTARNLGFDYMNRLVACSNAITGAVTRYAYDALGRRIKKATDGNPAQTVFYFYCVGQVC